LSRWLHHPAATLRRRGIPREVGEIVRSLFSRCRIGKRKVMSCPHRIVLVRNLRFQFCFSQPLQGGMREGKILGSPVLQNFIEKEKRESQPYSEEGGKYVQHMIEKEAETARGPSGGCKEGNGIFEVSPSWKNGRERGD